MKISLRNFLLLLCLLFQMQWARAQDDPQYRMEIRWKPTIPTIRKHLTPSATRWWT